MHSSGGWGLYILMIFMIASSLAGYIAVSLESYGISSLYLSLISFLAGLTALVYSKRKNLKNKSFFNVGPYSLGSFDKKIYHLSYILIFFGLCSLFAWAIIMSYSL